MGGYSFKEDIETTGFITLIDSPRKDCDVYQRPKSSGNYGGEYLEMNSPLTAIDIKNEYFSYLPKKLYKTIEVRGHIFSFTHELIDIYNEINESVEMLDLEESWDDDGAHSITKNTWLRAVLFLDAYANYVIDKYDIVLLAPDIAPVPNGSIDLTWHSEEARLLININSDTDTASFYGDYYSDNDNFKGNISTSNTAEHFAVWLKVFKKNVGRRRNWLAG